MGVTRDVWNKWPCRIWRASWISRSRLEDLPAASGAKPNSAGLRWKDGIEAPFLTAAVRDPDL